MNFKDLVRNTEIALNRFLAVLFPLNEEDAKLWTSPRTLTELSVGNNQGTGYFKYSCGEMAMQETKGFPHYYACAFNEYKQYLVLPNAVGMSLEEIQSVSLTIKPTYELAVEVFIQNAKNIGLNDFVVNEILKTFRSSFDEAWSNWTPEKIDVTRFNKIFPSIDPLMNPDVAAEKIHNLVLTKLKGGIGEKINISFIENLTDKLYLNIDSPHNIKKGSILEKEFYDLQQSLSPNYCHIVLAVALARVINNWQHSISIDSNCIFKVYQDYEGEDASFLLDFSGFKEYTEFKEMLVNSIAASPEEKTFFEYFSTLDGSNYSGLSVESADNTLDFICLAADKARLNLFD